MSGNNLSGKIAIVTGSSRGIGAAIASRLAQDGASVVVNYAGSADKAEEVVNTIEASGGRAVAVQADVGKLTAIARLFDETLEKFGKVDILVNNAGVQAYKLIADVTEQDFDRLFNTNVKGTFFACQQAARLMTEGGRIINFSTSVTHLMLPTYSTYAATKGAIEQITRHLAKELGQQQITVNCVSPGPTNTPLFTEGKTPEQIEHFAQMASLGRLGEPADIARVVAFLASDEAGWISGQNIRVNGGFA